MRAVQDLAHAASRDDDGGGGTGGDDGRRDHHGALDQDRDHGADHGARDGAHGPPTPTALPLPDSDPPAGTGITHPDATPAAPGPSSLADPMEAEVAGAERRGAGQGAKLARTREEQMLEEARELPPVPLKRIWGLQRHDWPWFAAGLAGSCGAGASRPIFAIIYSGIITAYFSPDLNAMRSQARRLPPRPRSSTTLP
jgi:hypothetical protein